MSPLNSMQDIKQNIEAQRDQIFTQLKEIVAFNSVHSEPKLLEDYAGAANWTRDALQNAGFEVSEFLAEDGTTNFIGTRKGAADAPKVLLYSHFDVVPSGPLDLWDTNPFELTERDAGHGTRWYGRGAADCKGNLIMHLAALRAVEASGNTNLNLTFVVEGSEEMGGGALSALIKEKPELFDADVILIADSGNAAVGIPTLTTTLRGGGQVTVTINTLEGAVHSGQYGGAAPDAVAALVRVLDTLRDEHGRTVIDGVNTTANWEGAPYNPDTFRSDAGILDGVDIMGNGDNPASMLWSRPAISITGFTSTPVAEALNAVPATASAKLNLRVPAGLEANEVAEKLKDHLIKHTPWGAKITVEIDDINQPFSTDITGPAMSTLASCLSTAYDGKELATEGSGGSIPLCTELMELNPNAELALYGVEEPLTVIHSANESVDPNEIRDIATAEALFLLNYAK
ncbi:dipeptidase [Corynebacterium crudilactis]|uniref:Dipeptidase n=1 Tax=Corynebacterium crudilactis TaxID=1652495 RepID=A0A172QW77_9CORY|nr:dipeptidase [Corynebacterium crudilactis]ANE04901.1 dipeptidase [Corynebacterium crudilactis]